MTQITKIHNLETGEIVEREMTPEEIAQSAETDLLINEQRQAAIALAAEKAAVLAKLGLTAEEVTALLS